MEVHKKLGSGFLGSVYSEALEEVSIESSEYNQPIQRHLYFGIPIPGEQIQIPPGSIPAHCLR